VNELTPVELTVTTPALLKAIGLPAILLGAEPSQH
jgi:hypothetical protein